MNEVYCEQSIICSTKTCYFYLSYTKEMELKDKQKVVKKKDFHEPLLGLWCANYKHFSKGV